MFTGDKLLLEFFKRLPRYDLLELFGKKELAAEGKDIAQKIFNMVAEKIELKIDLVNDIEAHFDDFIYGEKLGKIDSLENILSNKISAVFRYEGKDFADIVYISRNKHLDGRI